MMKKFGSRAWGLTAGAVVAVWAGVSTEGVSQAADLSRFVHHHHHGLKSFRPPAGKKSGTSRADAVSDGSGYTPAQIKQAYGFDQITEQGDGQTIAIVDALAESQTPTQQIQQVYNAFSTWYGLPTGGLTIQFDPGDPAVTNRPSLDSAELGEELDEIDLDVQWAHAIAPHAKVLLVLAASSNSADMFMAIEAALQSNLKPSVLSMSFGEAITDFTVTELQQYYCAVFNLPGVVSVASAGDSGQGAQWPASCANVVGVGGTTLAISTAGAATETTWASSGGGLASHIPRPDFQSSYKIPGTGRATPDVAYVANPATGVSFCNSVSPGSSEPNCWPVGGTSVGAPQIAAAFALLNQRRGASKLAAFSTTDALEFLYRLGKSEDQYFYDVTVGKDGTAAAKVGYDTITGLGRPLFPAVLTASLSSVLTGVSTTGTQKPSVGPITYTTNGQATGPGQYLGDFDGIYRDPSTGDFTLQGWTCLGATTEPLTVQVIAGTAKTWTSYANWTTLETAVASAPGQTSTSSLCVGPPGSAGGPFRFNIPLSAALVQQYAGKPIALVINNTAITLFSVGHVYIPDVSNSAAHLTGAVNGESAEENGTRSLLGWACLPAISNSVSVTVTDHIGIPIGTYLANSPSEASIQATKCTAGGDLNSNHRFIIPLSSATLAKYSGQVLEVLVNNPITPGTKKIGTVKVVK